MSNAGTLTAEQDGPNVRFTMKFPDGHAHAFTVEKLYTNPAGESEWRSVHMGNRRFLRGTVGYETAVPDGGTYRALAYRLAARSVSGVPTLHTEGVYTDAVTVEGYGTPVHRRMTEAQMDAEMRSRSRD